MTCRARSFAFEGCYFFTARLQDRRSDLLLREVTRLREAVWHTRSLYPFDIEAMVVLPSLIHTMWILPDEDTNFARRWRLIKSVFEEDLQPAPDRSPSQEQRGDKGIWQARLWSHKIRDRSDFSAHLDMIHSAPVIAGLVCRAEDWACSPLHRGPSKPVPSLNPQDIVGANSTRASV